MKQKTKILIGIIALVVVILVLAQQKPKEEPISLQLNAFQVDEYGNIYPLNNPDTLSLITIPPNPQFQDTSFILQTVITATGTDAVEIQITDIIGYNTPGNNEYDTALDNYNKNFPLTVGGTVNPGSDTQQSEPIPTTNLEVGDVSFSYRVIGTYKDAEGNDVGFDVTSDTLIINIIPELEDIVFRTDNVDYTEGWIAVDVNHDGNLESLDSGSGTIGTCSETGCDVPSHDAFITYTPEGYPICNLNCNPSSTSAIIECLGQPECEDWNWIYNLGGSHPIGIEPCCGDTCGTCCELGDEGTTYGDCSLTMEIPVKYDVHMTSDSPNYCGNLGLLYVGCDSTCSGANKETLISFDVNQIPINAVVDSAKLYVYVFESYSIPTEPYTYDATTDIYEITSYWSETMNCEWNDKPSYGSQVSSGVLSVLPCPYSWQCTPQWVAFDIPASSVENMRTSNNGYVLKSSGPDKSYKIMHSSEASHPNKPYLEVKVHFT